MTRRAPAVVDPHVLIVPHMRILLRVGRCYNYEDNSLAVVAYKPNTSIVSRDAMRGQADRGLP